MMRRQPRKPRRLVHPVRNNPAAQRLSPGQASNEPPVEKLHYSLSAVSHPPFSSRTACNQKGTNPVVHEIAVHCWPCLPLPVHLHCKPLCVNCFVSSTPEVFKQISTSEYKVMLIYECYKDKRTVGRNIRPNIRRPLA